MTRLAAIFAGNYVAKKNKSLNTDQLIKVLVQAFTVDKVVDFLNLYTPDPSMGVSFLKSYTEAILIFAAVAITDIVYENAIDIVEGKKMSLSKEDLRDGIYQGAIVALAKIADLY